jgi:hypothetical protein
MVGSRADLRHPGAAVQIVAALPAWLPNSQVVAEYPTSDMVENRESIGGRRGVNGDDAVAGWGCACAVGRKWWV